MTLVMKNSCVEKIASGTLWGKASVWGHCTNVATCLYALFQFCFSFISYVQTALKLIVKFGVANVLQ